ncbi:MAG: porin family protein, partial [Bdellovibrionales bacterium]|nr:porin family protein [Bdellovibrionales bacterium]
PGCIIANVKDNNSMRILHLVWLSSLMMFALASAFADEVYFLDNLQNCQIEMYKEKSLIPVNPKPFINVILNVKTVPKKPDYVAFKFRERIFVTRGICVIDASKKNLDNKLIGNEYQKKPHLLTEREKFNSYKYFVELDTGMVNVLSRNPVAADYNAIMPNNSSNPTVWEATGKSDYNSGSLISLGFGVRSNHERFVAFKIRLLSGKKSDPVGLYDQNTGLTQYGTWNYEDTFKNFYIGYKYIFRDFSAWKPTFGAYLGLSHMSSTLTEGAETFSLTSLGVAALIEGGIEYHLNSHWGLGAMLGFEYLGSRSMTFRSDTAPKFKTDMSYNNQYLSLGVKYYFK